MSDILPFKVWHSGKLVRKKKSTIYVGGSSDVFHVDVDKLSYLELVGYVMDYGPYEKQSFFMYYVKPGYNLHKGLVLLNNDEDVFQMLKVIGDQVKHVVHLYVVIEALNLDVNENEVTEMLNQACSPSSMKGAHVEAQPETPKSPSVNPNLGSAITPLNSPTASTPSPSRKFTKSSARRLPVLLNSPAAPTPSPSGKFTKSTARRLPVLLTQHSDEGSDDEIIAEAEAEVESEQDVVIGAESDTDDDEWIESTAKIALVNQEDGKLKSELVKKVLDSSENEPNETEFVLPDSDYEESDDDVDSPCESEEGDISARKSSVKVSTPTEFTDWAKWEWVPGTRFPTIKALKEAIRLYAVTNGRNLRICLSDKRGGGRLGAACVPGCPFRLYATFFAKKQSYIVKSVIKEHNCQRNMAKNRQLTSEFIADQFLEVFKVKPHWPAKEIQDTVKEKYKVLVSRWFAYNAKRSAHKKLHGSMLDHYSKLGSYLAALKAANPTSTFELVTVPPQFYGDDTSEVDVFYRIFVCFDGVKKGFLAGCRKMLCLDGCFLKTFLGGMLLAAIGRDPNDQMFPVAWAVVEGENTLSWTWFMSELKKCLDVEADGEGWTLVSDQQKGLLNAVVSLWPRAEHRNCARHIYANWNKKHKGDELKELFWRAVRAYCEADYNIAMEEMRTLSSEAADAFLKQNPNQFCRCFLSTNNKSDVVVSNMAETFNGYIIKSRSKHLINMLEDIRLAIMTRLANNQRNMMKKEVKVCLRVQKKLDKSKSMAWKCEVFPSSATLFQVKAWDDVSVDIGEQSCTCRRWDLTGIPCYHVCAVAGFLNWPSEDFVNSLYTKEMYLKAYEHTIPPLPSEKFWPTIEMPLNPPPVKIMPGRPKKNRKKDPHENPKKPGHLTRHGMTMTCRGCGSNEHNIRRCTSKGKQPKGKEPKGKEPKGKKAKRKEPPASESQGKRKRGRPATQQDSQSTQQTTGGVVTLA